MKLGEIFRDHMVLQANKPIRVFGEGKGHAGVTFMGKTLTCDNDTDGKWVLEFPAMPYGGPYGMDVVCGGEHIIIHDIMVGEVILFSGQSNIQFRMVEEITDPKDYVDDDMMRIFVSERPEAGEPLSPRDGWVRCAKENVPKWSALAYLVSLEARKAGIPAVGAVACSQGASVIQSWIDEKIFLGSPLDIPSEKLPHDWKQPGYIWNRPGMLYHFMLERLIPYSFGNVVWYQGESNTSIAESEIYGDLLGMMIDNWRAVFHDDKLPFAVVVIADFREGEDWEGVQRAQEDAQNHIEGVVSVKSGDISEKRMIHPVTKWRLAKRIFSAMRDKHTI